MERSAVIDTLLLRRSEKLGEILVRPFQVFAGREASSGYLLLAVTAVAILWVNSPWGHTYHAFWDTHVGIAVGSFTFERTLHFWVNDGLMVIFFFVVGLELKREVLVGELASFRKAALPLFAAIGGMAVPAAIFLAFNRGTDAQVGWGVPMATDIAFTLAALHALGSRVPRSLTVFIVALAIADDLGAVLVIALFYSADISVQYLWMSGAVLASLIAVNMLGFRHPLPYVVIGVLLWFFVLLSGVHATVAGVLVAFTIPARSIVNTDTFLKLTKEYVNEFECVGSCGFSVYTNEEHQTYVRGIEELCHSVMTPLQRLENTVHPWVVFVIVPLFGLANAGLKIQWQDLAGMLTGPVSLGIVLGLFVGKQLGISLFTWAASRTGLVELPSGTTPIQIYAGAVLCGIGFTMSLFIGTLSFQGMDALDSAKMGILVGSALSCVVGLPLMIWATRARPAESSAQAEEAWG